MEQRRVQHTRKMSQCWYMEESAPQQHHQVALHQRNQEDLSWCPGPECSGDQISFRDAISHHQRVKGEKDGSRV